MFKYPKWLRLAKKVRGRIVVDVRGELEAEIREIVGNIKRPDRYRVSIGVSRHDVLYSQIGDGVWRPYVLVTPEYQLAYGGLPLLHLGYVVVDDDGWHVCSPDEEREDGPS